MILNTRYSHDVSPHHQRSVIHNLTITLCITLGIISLITVLILSFIRPDLILSLASSLTPITSSLTPFFYLAIKTTACLFLLYLLYSLLSALHLCLYMMKRQHEWHKAQEQIFGHAKLCFAGEWYVPFSQHARIPHGTARYVFFESPGLRTDDLNRKTGYRGFGLIWARGRQKETDVVWVERCFLVTQDCTLFIAI
jgi:hypothetical protein